LYLVNARSVFHIGRSNLAESRNTALTDIATKLTQTIWAAIGGNAAALDTLSFVGDGELTSAYAVTDLASAAVAAAALAIAELAQQFDGRARPITVDRRLASLWYGLSIRPIGWTLPPAWDAIAGDYRASDGWIRLHTNAPHHRLAAQRVLGPHADREAMSRAVAQWRKQELETSIVESGGCAAEMRSVAQWADHPQGGAVAREPLVHVEVRERASIRDWKVQPDRPLAGIRVLDLTRVLAGPAASRFLAGYGAEVLRIDPPDWNEPGVVPEMTLGKRCARLDLRTPGDRSIFEELLATADICLHGYRSDALARLGYDAAARRKFAPGLIDVSLCAYGWTGPWADRRGFDSLVQMSAGIADAGMRWRGADKPVPLPVQALDHATGYLMAATAVRGLTRRLLHAQGTEAHLSLARTAKLLVDEATEVASRPLAPETAADRSATIEKTAWGEARRLAPPAKIDGISMAWDYPASELGSAKPQWS
jgi:hypothetical protein